MIRTALGVAFLAILTALLSASLAETDQKADDRKFDPSILDCPLNRGPRMKRRHGIWKERPSTGTSSFLSRCSTGFPGTTPEGRRQATMSSGKPGCSSSSSCTSSCNGESFPKGRVAEVPTGCAKSHAGDSRSSAGKRLVMSTRTSLMLSSGCTRGSATAAGPS